MRARVAAGVVSIIISGLVGLVGFAMAADGASGAIAGGVKVRVVDVWTIDDDTCPTAIRVSYQGKFGIYDCWESAVHKGDRLKLYKSFFDDSFGTSGDQIGYMVMGGLLFVAMLVVIGSVSWLILEEPDPRARPPGVSVSP